MKNALTKLSILAALIISIFPVVAFADAASDEDNNIKIIFPDNLMGDIIAQTTPEMMSNLKFTSDADKAKTQGEVDTFHKEFLQNFNSLVVASLKENFTAEEIQQWADLEQTPLGKKTNYWLKTKYPAILNKAMDQPMQDLYKSIAQ